MVLYHWRAHQASAAQHPEAKLYAFEAGARAVYDHCKRIGLPVKKVEQGITYGFYHPSYENQQPLISVVIPNKDHSADLDKAITSLSAGNYKNLEFIIVENNSDQPETWKYYEELKNRFPEELPADFIDPAISGALSTSETSTAESNSAASHPAQVSAYHSAVASVLPQPVVKVVKWDGPFNYSAINNYGVQFTHGQYLLFLNNDIEEIDPDSIDEMIGYVQREDVGMFAGDGDGRFRRAAKIDRKMRFLQRANGGPGLLGLIEIVVNIHRLLAGPHLAHGVEEGVGAGVALVVVEIIAIPALLGIVAAAP